MTATKPAKAAATAKTVKPHSKLKSPYMLKCHWPRAVDGKVKRDEHATPVFVSELQRNDKGEVTAVKCFQTQVASPREYDDPLMVRLNDPHNRMGFEGEERVIRLRNPVWLPFDTANFGEAPKIAGRMPEKLWTRLKETIAAEKEEYAGSRVSRCPIYSWGA